MASVKLCAHEAINIVQIKFILYHILKCCDYPFVISSFYESPQSTNAGNSIRIQRKNWGKGKRKRYQIVILYKYRNRLVKNRLFTCKRSEPTRVYPFFSFPFSLFLYLWSFFVPSSFNYRMAYACRVPSKKMIEDIFQSHLGKKTRISKDVLPLLHLQFILFLKELASISDLEAFKWEYIFFLAMLKYFPCNWDVCDGPKNVGIPVITGRNCLN